MCCKLTSVIVFTDIAVVIVTIPYVNTERFSLVVVERSEALVPSASDCCLLRLVATAAVATLSEAQYIKGIRCL